MARIVVASVMAAMVHGKPHDDEHPKRQAHSDPTWHANAPGINPIFSSFPIPGLRVAKTVPNWPGDCASLEIDCSACTHLKYPATGEYLAVAPADVGNAKYTKLLLGFLEGHASDPGNEAALSNCYLDCGFYPDTMIDAPTAFGQYWPAGVTDTSSSWEARTATGAYCIELGCKHDIDPNACLRNDPHIHFAHGGYADFRGKHGAIFNLLSHTNLSVAARFRDAKYLDLNATRKVEGTYMTEAYMKVATATGKVVHVSLEAGLSQPSAAKVSIIGKKIREATLDVATNAGQPLREGNIQVQVIAAPAPKPPPADPLAEVKEGMKLILTQEGRWRVTVDTYSYLDVTKSGKDKPQEMWRVDVNMKPLHPNIEKEPVMPHGLVGQSFDGDDIMVDGKKDDYSRSEVVTTAQAEGAIEGVWSDYILESPFATDFKFSRFAASHAKARDVSKLSGFKKLRLKEQRVTIE